MRGRVTRYDRARGFGFITPDDKRTGDVFVHFSAIQDVGFRSLSEGDVVEFDAVPSTKKPGRLAATNVVKVGVVDEPQPYKFG